MSRLSMVAIASGLVVAGCIGSDGGSRASEAVGLAALAPEAEEVAVVSDAENALIGACMNENGFDYLRPPDVIDPGSDGSRRWGVLDRETAEAVGFHPVPELQSQIAASDEYSTLLSESLEAQGPGRRQAYDESLAACGEHAMDALGGPSADEHAAVVNQLGSWANEADVAAENSDAFQAVLRAWSECMTAAGYPDLANPGQAIDQHYAGEFAGPEEIRVAVADVGCKEEVDLWSAWQRAYEFSWAGAIEGDEEFVATYEVIVNAWVQEARDVVGESR